VDFLGLLVWLFKMISLMYFGKNQLHIIYFPLFVKSRSNIAGLCEIRVMKEKNNNSDNSSQLPYRYWWNPVCWSITRRYESMITGTQIWADKACCHIRHRLLATVGWAQLSTSAAFETSKRVNFCSEYSVCLSVFFLYSLFLY